MKKLNKILIGSLLTVAFCSCDSYLSHLPDDRAQIDSPDAIKELLVSAYPNSTYMAFCETMSDNVGDRGPNAFDVDGLSFEQSYFWKEQTAISQDTYNYYWASCYEAIAAANHALEAIAKEKNDEKYSAHIGEALMARAYAHFMLANIFSEHYTPSMNAKYLGIPYVTEPENVVFKTYKRGTLEQTYKAIEKDLTTALPLIDNSYYDVKSYHFNTDASHVFASRYYLYTAQWEKVIEHTNEVLTGDYARRLRQLNSQEHINKNYEAKQLFYTNSLESSNLLLATTSSVLGQYLGYHRYDLTIDQYVEFLSSPKFVPGMDFSHAVDLVGDFDHVAQTPKLAPHMKQVGLNANIGYPYIMAPLLTMEEALLNRAEAYAMTNQFDLAMHDLNTFLSNRMLSIDMMNTIVGNNDFKEHLNDRIITRFYQTYVPLLTPFYELTDQQRTYVNCITDMRRKEFLQEGMRWFDIKRFHIVVQRLNKEIVNTTQFVDVLTKDDKRRAVQIPQDAIANGIEMNPR